MRSQDTSSLGTVIIRCRGFTARVSLLPAHTGSRTRTHSPGNSPQAEEGGGERAEGGSFGSRRDEGDVGEAGADLSIQMEEQRHAGAHALNSNR